MSFNTTEIKAKIARIQELANLGLNTPRMIFIPYLASEGEISKAMSWAERIHEKDHKQMFNIRTYKRAANKESAQTIHICDIDIGILYQELIKADMEFNCMLDAETPDNGRLAGNVVINTNIFKRPETYMIEYCQKETRAMVRDNDKSIIGSINELNENNMQKELYEVVLTTLNTKMHDRILEWTWFCGPAGVLGENLVFWEWRVY